MHFHVKKFCVKLVIFLAKLTIKNCMKNRLKFNVYITKV